jgi:hypothetical protein
LRKRQVNEKTGAPLSNPVALIGFRALATGAAKTCPLDSLRGMNTQGKKAKKTGQGSTKEPSFFKRSVP